MTMMTHAHNPHMLQGHIVGATEVAGAQSHLATIKRFAKFALMLALFAIAVTGIMAIRVVAWFPPFHH